MTALVQLAHKLGLTVTAECVEGRSQAERLRRIGCDSGQGWYYARPMPADRVTALLTRRGPPPGEDPGRGGAGRAGGWSVRTVRRGRRPRRHAPAAGPTVSTAHRRRRPGGHPVGVGDQPVGA